MTSLAASGWRIGRWVGRAGAALAALSAVLHAASLGHTAHQDGAFATVAMVVMICGCLNCARHLWCRATPADWATVAVASLVMIALHTPPGAPHHVHSSSSVLPSSVPAAQVMPVMSLAIGTAVAEAAIATIALVVSTNLRNRRLSQGLVASSAEELRGPS